MINNAFLSVKFVPLFNAEIKFFYALIAFYRVNFNVYKREKIPITYRCYRHLR